jgi:6-phosphogluconolactonase
MTERRGAVEVFPTAEAMTRLAAHEFVVLADRAIRRSGRFAVALSGGNTPRDLYRLLAAEPYASQVDWDQVQPFWGDERCVPPDDPASNYRMAREALLDGVQALLPNVHRIRGEDDPTEAAAGYQREIRTAFGTPDGPPQSTPGHCFDLVLLGLGEDGHTASLFPGTAAVLETERWVVGHRVAAVPEWRITLTPPVLTAAGSILFLVSGSNKAAALHRVIEGPYRPLELPAQVVASGGQARWLVDAAAASQLGTSGAP